MALRPVILPVIGSGAGTHDARRPKYVTSADGIAPPAIVVNWGGLDYGFEPWMVVVADFSAADVTFLQAQPDAFLIPVNLDALLTAPQVTNVSAKLEAINLPADQITTALTWRTVMRRVLADCAFMGRFAVLYATGGGNTTRLFAGGDLTRTLASLPALIQSTLTATFDDQHLDRSSVTGATTLRQLFNLVADLQVGTALSVGALTV